MSIRAHHLRVGRIVSVGKLMDKQFARVYLASVVLLRHVDQNVP